MLRELQIKNFKAWADSGKIRMAPLTIFCGNNSSGKSSIAQFLLLLKQTVESYDRQRVLNLGDKSSLIDLGTYRSLVHNHITSDKIEFCFTFDHKLNKISDVKNSRDYGPFKKINFSAQVSFDTKAERIVLDSMSYRLMNSETVDFSLIRDQNNYELKSDTYKIIKRTGRPWKLPPPENFFGFPDEAVAYNQNSGFLPDLSLSIKNLIRSIYYIGPLREYPERQYQFSGEIPPHVGIKGEHAIQALLAGKNRKISRGARMRYETLEQLVARWLTQMSLIYKFKIDPIAKDRKEYEVKIQIHKNSAEVLITDVGFGISQVLPILVQSFYASPGTIMFFEQPEIHLHPSVQSHLADLFIEAIHARENGKDTNNQLIIESHSEHLIRRLQRRIAEKSLTPEEVAIYFIRYDREQAILEEMNIDLFGNILNWPENFFGDDLEDLAAMTKAARTRKQSEKNA